MTTPTNHLIGVLKEALVVAGRPRIRAEVPVAGLRELEILFYGMMCFDPLEDGTGYRVLFPNGLELSDLADIPVHAPALWVRSRDASATARWSGFAFRNDFFLKEKRQLTISGLTRTPLNADDFEARVTNLQNCADNFAVSDDPDTVLEMIVDRGTLTAHVVNSGGMIVVRWAVQVEAGSPVRFEFDDDFVEIPPDVTQVFLANVSASTSEEETERHFQLYRKIAKDRATPLRFVPTQPPLSRPSAPLALDEPTFGYTSEKPNPARLSTPVPAAPRGSGLPLVGAVPQFAAVAFTPEVVCSAVLSRPRSAATG